VPDASNPGTQTIGLESFGSYSVAVYLREDSGNLINYSYFHEGLVREGISIISGQVSSEIGRGLQWVQISLVDGQGTAIAATNTDLNGHYSLSVIVPSDTDGSNLTLTCGLGDKQQNYTITELVEQNTINFQFDAQNNYLQPLTFIAAALEVLGMMCLAAWVLANGKKDPAGVGIGDSVPPVRDPEPEKQDTGQKEKE